MALLRSLRVLLLALCVFLITAADGNSLVKVEEGRDVVLPCSLSSKQNIESKLFDWKREGKMEVFIYDGEDGGKTYGNGRPGQDKEFEGRVSHFQEELKNGNASIKITKTKLSDSGVYTCDFPKLQPRQTFNIQLVVGTCPKPSAKQIKVTDEQAVLQCVVKRASPKPKVEWKDSSGNILPAKETNTGRGGSLDITLQTNVTKTDNYSCVVTQEEICHQLDDDILVYLPGSAGLLVSTGVLAVFCSLLVGLLS
ncbi:butyrophilin subfamily 2 member A2-like isoform X2 [Notolabrus celidotus]|uniref:butyrophilin subfamily 2 member A2-like isoform X2 n=1 Tax=Notolabrus celidotus TaxID=1203425 RepID=UPI00148F68C5|nr:butyrophilin subfamily 2 member A2-like isoform X2 [Notolabrus celidotus]